MDAPICNVCLTSDILCSACNKKLEEGRITDSDLRVSRAIKRAAREFKPLDRVGIEKVIEGRGIVIVKCRKGDAPLLIGKNGAMKRKLSRAIGKDMRVVEELDDVRGFVGDLIRPTPLLGVNIIYRPGGEMLRVIIPERSRPGIPAKAFSEAVEIVHGKRAVVSEGGQSLRKVGAWPGKG